MILANPGIVEPDLFPLDTHLRAGNGGLIDLLAVDGSGALAILEFDRAGEDDLLRRSLGYQGWVGSQIHFLRRLYGPERIHPFRAPRAFLLSTRFSGAFLRKVAELPVPLTAIVYRLSHTGGSPYLHLEPGLPAAGPEPEAAASVTSPFREGAPAMAVPATPSGERLTAEELEAFYDFERQRLRHDREGGIER